MCKIYFLRLKYVVQNANSYNCLKHLEVSLQQKGRPITCLQLIV